MERLNAKRTILILLEKSRVKKIISHLRENILSYMFETVVVALGILGALALDNWNDQRKNNLLENQFLVRLKIDLEEDIEYYNKRKSESLKDTSGLREYIQEAYSTQKSIRDINDLLLNFHLSSKQLTTQNVTYVELISTGQINIFKNNMLKRKAIEYYQKNERAAAHIKEYNESSAQFIPLTLFQTNHAKYLKFFSDIWNDPEMFIKNEWNWINDPTSNEFRALETTAIYYYAKHTIFIKYFDDLRTSAENLVELIDRELNKRE